MFVSHLVKELKQNPQEKKLKTSSIADLPRVSAKRPDALTGKQTQFTVLARIFCFIFFPPNSEE